MSEAEDLTKQVDQVYKNLLDKFNPAARNLITAGKAYLKALHGAMSASKIYLDALTKVARHSQQGTWGGSSDVGMCLMQMVDVYKEVQSQQMNILKAFYVDLLVPLETNLDKDTKVLQAEQKKFLASHKQKYDTYTKAASQLKKHKKKNRANKGGMDKEIKQYQAVEEERLKLEGFVESSLQNAVTQERRRYGFILERQCSLAKHYLAYHGRGSSLLQHTLDNWQDVAKTRESLPERLLSMLPSARPRDEGIYSTPLCLEEDAMSISSQVRKARSMDASCLDLSNAGEEMPSRPLTRARSEFALDQHRFTPDPSMLRRSMVIPEDSGRRAMARALYPYMPSGDNQLSFNEMDLIALIGEKNKGWQYGENLRTQRCGWFPVAYTEIINEEDDSALGFMSLQYSKSRSSVEDASSHGPSSLPGASSSSECPSASSLMTASGPLHHHHHHPAHHHHHRGHQKQRSASAGVVQFRASSPTSSSHATASVAASSLPVTNEPSACPSTSAQSSCHIAASSLETLRSSTTTTSASSSTNTVLFNLNQHHHHHHHSQPPRVSAPTIKKSASQHGHSLQSTATTASSNSCGFGASQSSCSSTSKSGIQHSHSLQSSSSTSNSCGFNASSTAPSTSSSTTTLTRSHTTAAASSHLSSRFQKRGGSGSLSFHSSDDSGFSNESGGGGGGGGVCGSLRPPANPEVDYSDDDDTSGVLTNTTTTQDTTTTTTTTVSTTTTNTTSTTPPPSSTLSKSSSSKKEKICR